MPKNKDFKRLVRQRMAKTGESYTAARARLMARGATSGSPESPEPPPPDLTLAERAGTSDDAVRSATGKNWAEWVVLLDAAGVGKSPHRDIAEAVASAGVDSAWWIQTVAVGYERIRGLWLTTVGEAKSRLQIEHRKLPDRDALASSKRVWSAALDSLAGLLAADTDVDLG